MAGLDNVILSIAGGAVGILVGIIARYTVEQRSSFFATIGTATSELMRGLYEAVTELIHAILQVIAEIVYAVSGVIKNLSNFQTARAAHKVKVSRPENECTQPPKLAKLVMRFFVKPRDQDALLGDMQEMFHKVAAEHSTFIAQLWYVWHTIWVVLSWPLAKLTQLGFVVYIADFIRKIIAP